MQRYGMTIPFDGVPLHAQRDWIVEWLRDPQKWLPGTRMPNFFFYYDEGEQKYVELMPNGELKAGLSNDVPDLKFVVGWNFKI